MLCPVEGGYNVDITSDPTDLRRLPTSWRIDLRAEREYRFSGWTMHVYAEMQNASLTHEVVGWDIEENHPFGSGNYRVVPTTLFVPLPIVGMEVTL